MKLFQEQLDEWLKRNPTIAALNPELGAGAELQKLKTNSGVAPTTAARVNLERDPNTGDRQASQTLDEGGNHKYRISVTFRVSDNGVRDNDGMLSTILDCLVSAGRRLAGVGNRSSKNGSGPKRR